MSTTTTAQTGTVKIGRWAYPARATDGAVERNTKRDGTGAWISAPAELFTADVAPQPEPEVKLTPNQTVLMALVGQRAFDFFDQGISESSGIWLHHMAWQARERTGRRDASIVADLRKLEAAGLWEVGELETDLGEGVRPDRWIALTELGARVAQGLAHIEVPAPEAKPERETKGHGGKEGAQTRKPGKSTWEIGTPCPAGIHILTDADIYVMPSGRTQCRSCRRGYPSNA